MSFALTPKQQEATIAAGSVAVTAGAGTGKTRMLAERYLHHVREHGLSPLSVVAVTFTDKAAAELRSRIRQTLIEKLDDSDAIAEVETAQISTIHSLAARICRDFYDLAGIPADFTVLDETDAPLWMAEKFDEALGGIDSVILSELGIRWLTPALQTLLRSPIESEKALRFGAETWKEAIERARRDAVAKLKSSDAWTAAERVLKTCRGATDDTLEGIRVDVRAAMSGAEPVAVATELGLALKRFKSNSGSAKKWDAADLTAVRECLIDLKSAVKLAGDYISLEYNEFDDEIARRLPLLAEAFRYFRGYLAAEKLNEKVLDFNDLEHYALEILRHDAAVEHYRTRWKAFLVDEFQDTNPVQAEILDRLTRSTRLTVVGDEKQSIYGFRGADVTVFRGVRASIESLPGGKTVGLDITFRSHRELTVSMNGIFAPVLGDLHQPLEAHRTESKVPAPFIRSFHVGESKGSSPRQRQVIESRLIAAEIKSLHDENDVAYGDIAILGRRWSPLETYLDFLSSEGIPAVNAGGGSLLETREAQDAYAMLSFLADQKDSISLIAILRSPYFAFSDRELADAATKDVEWWQNVRRRPEFSRATSILEKLIAAAADRTAEQVLRLADELTGYGAVIANLPQASRRMADRDGVYSILRKLESRGKADVFGTARYLRELYATETDIPRPQVEAGDAVSLMTIHKAKGLEWPVVFIPDLASAGGGSWSPVTVDSELGVAFKIDGDDYEKNEPAIYKLIKLKQKEMEAEEDKRLLYVAVTRAKDAVFLTAGKSTGSYLSVLRPGLDAIGVDSEELAYDEALAESPSPGDPESYDVPEVVNREPVKFGPVRIAVTALTTYARCPKQFEFDYVIGHPGVDEGSGTGRIVGTLTHSALEHNIREADALRAIHPDCGDDLLGRAITLAKNFDTADEFAAVRDNVLGREVPLSLVHNGLTLTGNADIVGDDFVLDHKTDAEMHPEEHRFQLWAYARALGKPNAYIAYLSHNQLHRFTAADLASLDNEAELLIKRISHADYTPTPSPAACHYCNYRSICEVAF